MVIDRPLLLLLLLLLLAARSIIEDTHTLELMSFIGYGRAYQCLDRLKSSREEEQQETPFVELTASNWALDLLVS